MMGGFGFGGMLFGGLIMLAFWVLVIVGVVWLVVWLVRGASGSTHTNMAASPSSQTPLEILKMRYAKGEITKEQYEEMKREFGG